MNRNYLLALLFLLCLVLSSLWIGCAGEPLTMEGSPVKTFKGDSFTLTTIFLDEMTLKKRYGKKNNPFINVHHLITPRRFMVFDVIIKAEREELKLELNKMRLEYAAINVTPRNRFLLYDHWKVEDRSNEDVKPMDTRRKELLINKTLFPDKFGVSAGSTIKGLVLFSANFPKSGNATLTIPVFDRSGALIEESVLEFRFKLY
jgi:hypothetical protein